MGSGDDKTSGRSGPFEVVADRSQDGSFEIRLSRSEDGTDESFVAEQTPVESAAWSTDVVQAHVAAPVRRTHVAIALAAGVGCVLAIFFAFRTPGPSARPKTVEVSHASSFRGFVIATQAPSTARSVRVAFPEDAVPSAAPAPQNNGLNAPGDSVGFGNSVQVRGDVVPSGPPQQQQMGYAEYNRLHRDEALENLRNLIEGEMNRRAEQDAPSEPEQVADEVVEEEVVDEEIEEVYEDYEE